MNFSVPIVKKLQELLKIEKKLQAHSLHIPIY